MAKHERHTSGDLALLSYEHHSYVFTDASVDEYQTTKCAKFFAGTLLNVKITQTTMSEWVPGCMYNSL